jgi:hypothetical protein
MSTEDNERNKKKNIHAKEINAHAQTLCDIPFLDMYRKSKELLYYDLRYKTVKSTGRYGNEAKEKHQTSKHSSLRSPEVRVGSQQASPTGTA